MTELVILFYALLSQLFVYILHLYTFVNIIVIASPSKEQVDYVL